MIHTFSPNWYRPQCLLFHQNHLYYASNYVLYRYNLTHRKVQTDKCFRKIAMTNNMNSKDIKIYTINKLAENWLIVGTNQPHLIILSMIDFQVLGLIKNLTIEQSYLCASTYDQQEKISYFIAIDENGSIAHITITNPNTYKIKSLSTQHFLKLKPKQLIPIKNTTALIYNRGQFRLFNKNLQQINQQIDPPKIGLGEEHILSSDIWEQKSAFFLSTLSKSKTDNMFIRCWEAIMQEKQNETPASTQFKEVISSQIKISYPKSLTQKLKNAQKAAMVIKYINSQHILLTGKLGQIFLINIKKCPINITIKPHSIQNIPDYLQILNDSKHYKEIYAVYIHQLSKQQQQLYTISTDQTMNIWNIIENTIIPLYSIKFVTAQLSSIFYNETDPQTIYFLLKDSIIRSTAPLGTQNYYLTQYWKYTKKFKIVKAVAHLSQPGITAMLTSDNKIIVYDLFDERLMKIVDVQCQNQNQQVLNITFQYTTILQPIQLLTRQIQNNQQISWITQTIKSKKLYSKQLKNGDKIGILVQQKNTLLFIREIQQKQDQVVKIQKVCRIERVHNTKLWDGHSLLMTQYKNNSLKIWIYWKDRVMKLDTSIKLGGRCVFKIQEPLLHVLQYKAKKTCIYDFSLENQLNQVNICELELPFNAEQAVINYHSWEAAFYNAKDDSLALLKLQKNQPSISLFEMGNKIQSLAFYLHNYMVAGFKDQSLKLLEIAQLFLLKDQPHKKVKKFVNEDISVNEKYHQQQIMKIVQ